MTNPYRHPISTPVPQLQDIATIASPNHRPEETPDAILEWVATRSDPAVATAWTCGLAATTLAWMLRLIRRNPQIVADTIQGTGHMWVEMDGKYYDPTIGQFGDLATSGDLPHPLCANPKAAIPIIHEVDAPRDTGGAGTVAWRCYHCDEVFTDDRCARLHFGRDETCAPACQIKAGAERGLIYALREAEYAAADAQLALATESTEAAKAYYAQASRHAAALRSAEEAGYERGLADGRALANPAPQPSGDAA